MKRSIGILAIVVVLVAFFAAGQVAHAKEPYRIGVVVAATGSASFLGEPEKKTLELLVKEANAKGGINGSKIELTVYDTGGDVTKAVQLANK
ncbi:MAG TPA: ABC transporter substrate-binding protein, partial [Dissulfurispiraceae bacterium]